MKDRRVFVAILREDDPLAPEVLAAWGTEPPDVRYRSRLGRALLRGLVGDVTTTAGRGWVLTAEPSGRPILGAPDGRSPPSVSLSHSGGWVACAAAWCGSVGLDIEVERPRDVQALAEAAFGPRERACVSAGGAAVFYRIWTLREAIAKTSGEGFAQAVDRTDRVADHADAAVGQAGACQLFYERPADRAHLAVALAGSPGMGGDAALAFRQVRPDPSR